MAASNTNILIKRSSTTGKPSSLKAGEVAYSYVSNTLFFGTSTGDGVVNVGGQYYTATLDAATSSNTASTLVKRNADGNFFGRLLGNANTATTLETARNFSISGGDISASAQSFDGSGAITLNATLNSVPGLSAGVYGGVTAIPVLEVAANGRVMAISNTTVSTTLNISGDTGTDGVNLLNDTLTFNGGQGVTTAVTDNVVSIFVDDTVVRANGFTGGTQTINTNLTIGNGKDLSVTGNLIVTGNVVSQNVQQLAVSDPLIVLGIGNYASDTYDIGFAAHYNDGSNAHTGLIRDSGTKEYHFFKGYTPDLDANNNINLSDPSYQEANVHAAYFKGNLIASTVDVDNLQVNQNIFASNIPNARTGNLVYFDTANGRFSYADDNELTPTSIANGSYSLSIQSTDGLLVTNGSGIQLTNGAIIKDTASDAVAFGQNAGTINQGSQAVAIGDSAGYNSQGAFGVAIGYGAGNVNQGQTAVAIGLNAGMSNQGHYSIAIGNSSGGSQGQYSIALGYDSGQQQGKDSIAIGTQAGKGNTSAIGINTIAIGNKAGFESAPANTIILNATGSDLSPADEGLYVAPIRTDATSNNILYYNDTTKEITYGTLADIRTDVLSNGIYSYTISGDDGGLRSNVSSQIIGGTEGGIKISYWSGANTGMQIQNEIVGEDLFINAFDTGRALLRWHSTSVDPEIANSRVLFSAQSDGAYIKNIFWDSNTASYLTHAWWFKPNGTLSLPHSAIINDANNSIDIGHGTKTGTVGVNRVSIGTSAGLNAQGSSAIAIGQSAGNSNQSTRAIALGYFAAPTSQGQDSIAIGSFAGQYGAVQGSIILNASGSPVNGNNSGFFVSPMSYTAAQDATYDGVMFYNSNTKEVRYSYALDGGEF